MPVLPGKLWLKQIDQGRELKMAVMGDRVLCGLLVPGTIPSRGQSYECYGDQRVAKCLSSSPAAHCADGTLGV